LSATAPAESLPILKLRHGEDRRLRAGHLWVFSNEIDIKATPLTGLEPGGLVRVVTERDHFMGYAYANPATLIAARIVSRSAAHPVGPALFDERLRRALALRERLFTHSSYRWVFGESDGLPGLVLDRFGDVVVGQIATLGMQRLKGEIEAAVRRVLAPAVLYWKNDSGARALENLPAELELAWGEAPAALQVVESLADGRALHYRAPFTGGQKTGWFFDQAVNRAALARYVAPGARVLDVCSYAGAWAVTAMAAGAAAATCVDSSQAALDQALANGAANGFPITARRGDAFDVLAALAAEGERFDLVILDHDAELDGESETGSVDIEDHHTLNRSTAFTAELVLLVGRPGVKGVNDLIRLIDCYVELGVPRDRLVPVVNLAPRSPASRAATTRALAELTRPVDTAGTPCAAPLFVRNIRSMEEVHRSAGRLPDALTQPLARAVRRLLLDVGVRNHSTATTAHPIRPGDLGVDDGRAHRGISHHRSTTRSDVA